MPRLWRLCLCTENVIFPRISPFKETISFWGEKNTIFPDNTRKIIFLCNSFEKTIFSEHLKKISYFHVFFGERSSFISRPGDKTIFSGKRNIIFPDNTRNIMFQRDFFGKTMTLGRPEEENVVFCVVFDSSCTNLLHLTSRFGRRLCLLFLTIDILS